MSTISVNTVTGVANISANSVTVGSHVINTTAASFSTDISVSGTSLSSSHAGLRANRNITGGGNITFDGSANFKWSSRFIVISNGRGSHFSTNGYYDIDCPTSGTITGVGGASNQTATSSGITINAWHALYYILPIGSSNSSIAANFRLVAYTSDYVVPDTWVLIALRNDDNGVMIYVNNGISIRAGLTASNLIQTVYNRYDGKTTYNFATAGQVGTFMTDLSTSISPRLSTNKILINFCPNYEVQNDTIFKLYRSIGGVDTEIGTNVNDSNYWSGWTLPGYDADNNSTARTASLWYLDSPNTTSTITYKFMIQSGGTGATYLALNRTIGSTGQANYEVGISQVILQEIGL